MRQMYKSGGSIVETGTPNMKDIRKNPDSHALSLEATTLNIQNGLSRIL